MQLKKQMGLHLTLPKPGNSAPLKHCFLIRIQVEIDFCIKNIIHAKLIIDFRARCTLIMMSRKTMHSGYE